MKRTVSHEDAHQPIGPSTRPGFPYREKEDYQVEDEHADPSTKEACVGREFNVS